MKHTTMGTKGLENWITAGRHSHNRFRRTSKDESGACPNEAVSRAGTEEVDTGAEEVDASTPDQAHAQVLRFVG